MIERIVNENILEKHLPQHLHLWGSRFGKGFYQCELFDAHTNDFIACKVVYHPSLNAAKIIIRYQEKNNGIDILLEQIIKKECEKMKIKIIK